MRRCRRARLRARRPAASRRAISSTSRNVPWYGRTSECTQKPVSGLAARPRAREFTEGVLGPPPLFLVVFPQLNRDVPHRIGDAILATRECQYRNRRINDGGRRVDRPPGGPDDRPSARPQRHRTVDHGRARGGPRLRRRRRRAVIRGGGDRAFVSGGDLKELAALRTLDEAAGMARRMRAICDRIAAFPAPVIAALNGPPSAVAPRLRSRPTSGWPPTT